MQQSDVDGECLLHLILFEVLDPLETGLKGRVGQDVAPDTTGILGTDIKAQAGPVDHCRVVEISTVKRFLYQLQGEEDMVVDVGQEVWRVEILDKKNFKRYQHVPILQHFS